MLKYQRGMKFCGGVRAGRNTKQSQKVRVVLNYLSMDGCKRRRCRCRRSKYVVLIGISEDSSVRIMSLRARIIGVRFYAG
jgi:hypothetical protein